MAEKKAVKVDGKIWGRLPCGEIHEYDNMLEYNIAYTAEEDEIVDELARLEAERFIDYPEDWRA